MYHHPRSFSVAIILINLVYKISAGDRCSRPVFTFGAPAAGRKDNRRRRLHQQLFAFSGAIEAQTLCAVLPLIRAHRT
jgi:hypothetical protein